MLETINNETESNDSSPLHIFILNANGQVSQMKEAKDWDNIYQQKVHLMLKDVFPDLDEWFDLTALEDCVEEAVAVMVIDEENHPVGFAHARQESHINGKEGREKWLLSILASNNPGKGIGAKVIEILKSTITDYAAKSLFTNTDPTRQDTIRFYEKHGFEVDGVIEHYYYGPSPAVWMWCDLSQ